MAQSLDCTSRLAVAGLAVLGLLAAGCGKPTANVSGKVIYKGAPLPSGSVTFHGADNFVQSAWIGVDGSYFITKAPVGEVKVSVASSESRAASASNTRGKPAVAKAPKKHPGDTETATTAVPAIAIPEKYKDPNKSGLSYTLTKGQQTIDITLN